RHGRYRAAPLLPLRTSHGPGDLFSSSASCSSPSEPAGDRRDSGALHRRVADSSQLVVVRLWAACGRSLRRYGDDREHACLEVARDIADEEIGAGLCQIGGSCLCLPRVDVVAVADEGDARAVLDDVAVLIDRETRRGEIALEDQ